MHPPKYPSDPPGILLHLNARFVPQQKRLDSLKTDTIRFQYAVFIYEGHLTFKLTLYDILLRGSLLRYGVVHC